MSGFGKVLGLRGWQVFAILLVAVLCCVASMLLAIAANRREPGSVGGWLFGVSFAALEFLYFGWLLSVGTAMRARLQAPGLRPGVLATMLLVAVSYSGYLGRTFVPGSEELSFTPVIVALHIGAMLLNFYLLWYASRALVAAEEGGHPSVDRVIGLFMILWFTASLPFGAWWAQNRARRVAGLDE